MTVQEKKFVASNKNKLLAVADNCVDRADARQGQAEDGQSMPEKMRIATEAHGNEILSERDGAFIRIYEPVLVFNETIKAKEEKIDSALNRVLKMQKFYA